RIPGAEWGRRPEAPGLLRVAAQPEHLRARTRAEEAGLRVRDELLARVGDVEVAHRELADAVGRREAQLALFHRQALGLVGEVARFGVQDRVVVAAAQLQRHLA